MYKAHFKTAYLQRELPMDAIVVNDMVREELVKVTNLPNGSVVINKLVAESESAARAEATHFFAQADMTLEYGHVPVESMDYAYSDEIASSVDMDKVGTTYIGTFASTSDLPTSADSVSDGDTALVLDNTNSKLVKYVATVAETVVSWAIATSSAAYEVAYSNTKKVALYKIVAKYDIEVYDGD